MTRATPARSPVKARKKPGGAQPKRPRGRPPKYRPEFAERATDLCLLGATNDELAKVFGVDTRTISDWLVTRPEFSHAIKQGRELADMKVARALYLKATGQWTQPAVKIATKIEILPDGREIKSDHIVPYVEHFPPDTAAAFIWLKNRQPHRWRDKKEVHETGDHTSRQPVVFELSPAAQAHLDEVRRLLGPDYEKPSATAEGSPAGNEANGARKSNGDTTH
jgi:hypothetical protein